MGVGVGIVLTRPGGRPSVRHGCIFGNTVGRQVSSSPSSMRAPACACRLHAARPRTASCRTPLDRRSVVSAQRAAWHMHHRRQSVGEHSATCALKAFCLAGLPQYVRLTHAPTWLSTGTLRDSSRGAVARVPPERAGVRDTALQKAQPRHRSARGVSWGAGSSGLGCDTTGTGGGRGQGGTGM